MLMDDQVRPGCGGRPGHCSRGASGRRERPKINAFFVERMLVGIALNLVGEGVMTNADVRRAASILREGAADVPSRTVLDEAHFAVIEALQRRVIQSFPD